MIAITLTRGRLTPEVRRAREELAQLEAAGETDRDVLAAVRGRMAGLAREIVQLEEPTYADAAAVLDAFRHAAGFRDGDTEKPSQPANGHDLVAVQHAALGVTLRKGVPGSGARVTFGKLRDYDRDVIHFGDMVRTALWRGHYDDDAEVAAAGSEAITDLLRWFGRDEEAIAAATEGFGSRPPQPGGR